MGTGKVGLVESKSESMTVDGSGISECDGSENKRALTVILDHLVVQLGLVLVPLLLISLLPLGEVFAGKEGRRPERCTDPCRLEVGKSELGFEGLVYEYVKRSARDTLAEPSRLTIIRRALASQLDLSIHTQVELLLLLLNFDVMLYFGREGERRKLVQAR